MRFFHPVALSLMATAWLVIVLGWQVHRERVAVAKAKAELRIYIQASAKYAQDAMIATGQRDQCLAQF